MSHSKIKTSVPLFFLTCRLPSPFCSCATFALLFLYHSHKGRNPNFVFLLLLLLPPLLLFTQELQAKSCHGNDCLCLHLFTQTLPKAQVAYARLEQRLKGYEQRLKGYEQRLRCK